MDMLLRSDGFGNIDGEIVISSRVVAEELGKRHFHIRESIKKIIASQHLDWRKFFIENQYIDKQGKSRPEYLMTKDGFTLYMFNIQGYNEFKIKYIQIFNKMQKALEEIQFRQLDKKHQLEMMELLHDLLPEEEQKKSINYIKVNTIVNKTTTNYFGFPKMMRKKDMNNEMLKAREKILDDTLKLFEVIEDFNKIKDILYQKYQPKQIAYEEE